MMTNELPSPPVLREYVKELACDFARVADENTRLRKRCERLEFALVAVCVTAIAALITVLTWEM